MDKRHYDRAPITEAIIDVKVKTQPALNLDELEQVRDEDEATYPELRKIQIAHAHVAIGEQVAASAAHEQAGFAFINADKTQVFQARKDGFAFSRLAPYQNWEAFRDEAYRLWTKYRERIKPIDIIRLAVRYVNRFDVPGNQIEIKEYFRTMPEISPDLPQIMNGFFLRVTIPQDDLKATLLINQTIVPPAAPGVTSVVLDVDIFREIDVPSEEDPIWDYFERLRERKNCVFEACITEKARELIR